MLTWAEDKFDAGFYLSANPDVREAGMDPWMHFDRHGHSEGRVPHPGLQKIASALAARAKTSKTPLADIVGLFPQAERDLALSEETWNRLVQVLQPTFYAAQLGTIEPLTEEDALIHFLSEGAFAGLRPTLFFNSRTYQRRLREAAEASEDDGQEEPEAGFFHWLTYGWRNRIVPTPLFDEAFYLDTHKDLSRWKGWLFEHYIIHGCREGHRRPSPFVDAMPAAAQPRGIAIVDRVIRQTEGTEELRLSTPIEDVAAHLIDKLAVLDRPKYQELVRKAAAIEPRILRPYSARVVQSPPIRHGLTEVRNIVEKMRRTIGCTSADILMLIPHCRMAGSARVAGHLARALAEIAPGQEILVVTTDLPDFERPEWFPDTVRVIDISQHIGPLTLDNKARVLLDLVRGLQAKKVINVNSRLCWELYETYGLQLSTWVDLYAYLFTWDLDEKGNKGGYPITFFQSCFTHLKGVFVDNSALKAELVERYAMSRALQDRIHVLFTPCEPAADDFSGVFQRRRNGRLHRFALRRPRLQAIWAGRFDRQKRFDLVVEIAARMPDLDLLVWGKEVLGQSGVDFSNLPQNITLMGTYNDLSELPFAHSDFFLYTSWWDGLPTILIDVGMRGVPVVASLTGGVGDVVSDETGFPVRDFLDPEAYLAAIAEMKADPAEVTARAKRLRQHTLKLCDAQRYSRSLSVALDGVVDA
ncbi:glycosyltransferase family 4 protein [Nitratireductor sp. ZSWI3]|uniref:glycosyltransferase family 4 protein n=1 Tax=Nitratireductor sp. ZSWI3 TaxID=2966359 RepID=UPI00214F6E46|nr:glycosyltransferase family 4 protein [Nitratireductor sp. ZSWI3]MCR4265859.1 glycosyltransferase family 4 protein [Nitratireductor sp. ZSWI3]